MLELILGLPDLILFWMNDVSVICASRCGITRGTLSGKHVLTLIWMIMTGGSFKIVSNWAVLTVLANLIPCRCQRRLQATSFGLQVRRTAVALVAHHVVAAGGT